MNYTRQSIDNSLAIKQANEFFKDWTFETITLDESGDVMEDNEEPTVFLYAGTNVNGSTCSVDMGYTFLEWRNMTEEEKTDIINEFMANVCDVWVSGENGESVED